MSESIRTIVDPPRLPAREAEGHKGNYGRVLIVGGSPGMIGAPALSANAALRSGAGLVTMAIPAAIQQTTAPLCPCATSVALACDDAGAPVPAAIGQLHSQAAKVDVVAIGPGLGTSSGAREVLRAALDLPLPLLIDADGLNLLCKIDNWAAGRKGPTVLTPHPGEFSRLTGLQISEIQSDRQTRAILAATEWSDQAGEENPLTVLLKGAGTVVTDARRCYVNATGNPGMATGGAGDILTGMIAALIGQGLDGFDAACLGAFLHGRAGDLAADSIGQVSLIATDLLDFLPPAFRSHSSR
ncbi:MAG: NAD(P)H-hydrate dehydratase [Planctomycetota bacterium]